MRQVHPESGPAGNRQILGLFMHCAPLARRLLLWSACVAFAHVACLTSVGQAGNAAGSDETSQGEESLLSSYEGQTVSTIQTAGRPDFDLAQCAQCLVQKAGEPFDEEKVNETAGRLKAAARADHVKIQVMPEAKGVRIIFVLTPAVYLGIFQFPGAQQFQYSELIQAANYPLPEAFNPAEVQSDGQGLVGFFRREGFFTANVDPKVNLDSANALANVQFDSKLGKKAKFGTIQLQGAPDDEGPALAQKLTTLQARLRGAAIRPGKTYHHSTVSRSRKYLEGSLVKQGYLGAHVTVSGAEYDAQENRANMSFNINSGDKIHVQINGAHFWPWTRKSLLPMYQGVAVDEETVTEGRQALISYFQAKGFFDVAVESHFDKGPKADTVLYKVVKGKKHKVTEIQIAGNSALPSSRLTPQLAVDKKHLLSPGKFSDQLVQSSIKNLQAVYQSEGFSDAKVTSTVARVGRDVQITFRVTEGTRDVVNSLAIEGAKTFSQSQFAPDGLKLAVGQPYSQAHVDADRAKILANYLRAGYLNASFREQASEVSKSEAHRIDVVYQISEGPRVTTGNVITLGRVQTRQRLIDMDMVGIRKGQPLTESALLAAGSRLYDHHGVFDWAEVDPKEPVTTQSADDVLVKVHEKKRNELTYGFGFEAIERGGNIPSGTVALPNIPPIGLPSNFTTSQSTFYGPRGTFEYTRNNVRGKGESLSFTGFGGRLDQRAAAYYIDPSFRWTSWKATTSLSYERDEENPLFSSQQEQATLQFQHALDSARKNIFFAQYGFSRVDLTRLLIPSLVPTEDQHIRLSTLSANLTRDTRDNPLDEHRGVLDSLQLDFDSSKLGSNVNFAKLTTQAAFYREKFHHIVWAESIRVGLAAPFLSSFVPLSEAFFTGGGNSLRGFPLDSAGPQRQVEVCSTGSSSACSSIQVPKGGNELLIVNSEARIPLPVKKGLSFVMFYDGGNVFPDVGFHDFTSLYSNNVGLGLRYATPVGPIRIDIGRNLNPVQGVKATQYFIGIGQAF